LTSEVSCGFFLNVALKHSGPLPIREWNSILKDQESRRRSIFIENRKAKEKRKERQEAVN
jgi:hypothetical protein